MNDTMKDKTIFLLERLLAKVQAENESLKKQIPNPEIDERMVKLLSDRENTIESLQSDIDHYKDTLDTIRSFIQGNMHA